ncbi:MAG: sialidase family protein [Candidatus Angelobacter sp.]
MVIGEDVQVSASRSSLPHFETQLAADSENANFLIGCAMAFTPGTDRAETVVYLSRDAGKSWSVSLEDDRGKFSGDPACVYGMDGMAYFAAAGYGPDLKSSMRFYRSKDFGKTWLAPFTIQQSDREYITVNNGRGKSRGRVYVHGAEYEQALDPVQTWSAISSLNLVQSLDGGATFERPLRGAAIGDHLIFAMGNGAVLSDGTLVLLYGEVKDRNHFRLQNAKLTEPNAWLKIVKIQEGIDQLSKSTIVSDFYLAEETPRWRHNTCPVLAVDRSPGPFTDRLYAAWADIRSGRSQILLSHSEDKGKIWSTPIVIDDDRARPGVNAGPDDFMPSVAVNNKGVVGISWYDRRDSSDNLGWWVRFSASIDGGETFLPSVRAAKAPFALDNNQELLVFPALSGGGLPADWGGGGPLETQLWIGRFDYTGGDTAGIAADAAGIFHLFWIDNRTGVPQIWTNTISVSAAVFPNGDPELAALEDVSEQIILEYNNVHYDRTSGTGGMDVRLRNASKVGLSALRMRVLSLNSEAGALEIMDAENEARGSGALFDFRALLKGKTLKPGELTAPKRITFRLTGFGSIRAAGEAPLDNLLTISAKVLGKIEKQ